MPLNNQMPYMRLTVLALLIPLAACARMGGTSDLNANTEATITNGINTMLEDIYLSKKPVQFEQLDVSDMVLQRIPLGSTKQHVRGLVAELSSSKIIEDTASTLIVRDNKGRAMLDPDPRSILITFSFDANDRLDKVHAIHMKNQ